MSKKWDFDALKDCADPIDVAGYVGIEMKRMGKNISILCPIHNDKHFGNCFLTSEGFRCYSCGEKGDIYDMVSRYCNISSFEAFKLISKYYGGMKRFCLSSEDKRKYAEVEKKCSIIPNQETLEFLGLGKKSKYARNGVYVVKEMIGEFDEYKPEKNEYVKTFPSDNEKQGYKLVFSCVQRNPLQELAISDPEAFEDLIRRKAQETYEIYQSMIESIKTFTIKSERDFYCSRVANEVGVTLFIRTCEIMAKKAESIFIEHGGENIKTKNIFGNLKLGVAL